MIPAHIEHTFSAIDRILNGSSKPQQPRNRESFATVEGSSPCADTGTAGVSDLLVSQYRARIYQHERLIDRLWDLVRAERWDEAHDVVRAEYRAIHGSP
jgi:hypothetical protein